MHIVNKTIIKLVLLTILITNSNFAQEDFIIGAFIQSSDSTEITQYENYSQMKELGLNSVFQIAVKPVTGGPDSNLDTLTHFPYIFAANDSGAAGVRGAKINEFIDWISYFTHAKYTKWEAEGSPAFNENDGEDVKVKYEFGYPYTEGNISGRKSGMNSSNINKFLIKGPDYWQYPRYTFTNPGWNPLAVDYKVVFRMKIDDPSESAVDVCEISVSALKYDEQLEIWYDTTLASQTLTTDDLSTNYTNKTLTYNYEDFYASSPITPSYPSLPTLIVDIDGEEQISGYGLNSGSKVQFQVKWLGNRELFVDYIEVFDELIWEDWFIDRYTDLLDSIDSYDQSFATGSSDFYEKLKYYGTIDEPHSIDCYEPLRKVQFLLDSLNIDADLLIHFYPGWNGYRDGDKTWPQYNQLAQPQKLMFWYFPYLVEDNGTNVTDEFGLEQFRNNLQMAHTEQPVFFVETQTWGWLNSSGNYRKYRAPSPAQLKAQAMLALAHGVEGIYFEPYYSYVPGADTVTGLVYRMNSNDEFPPRAIYYTAQDLASRLNSVLGKTLMSLAYSGNYLQFIKTTQQSPPPPVSDDYLDLTPKK